jgi:hypothetical protein
MERTLLYYPTIDIPNMEWLYSSILYADKVSSIIPHREWRQDQFPSTIQFLIDQNQYKPIYIEEVLENHGKEFGEFENLFISTIDEKFDFSPQQKESIEVGKNIFTHIYRTKISEKLRRYFYTRDLIITKNNETYEMNETIALFYMGLLAQYVAKVTDDDLLIPSTDIEKYEEIAFGLPIEKAQTFKLIIENCLPVPIQNTPLEAIIDLKIKRRDELIEFRKFISKIQDKMKKATSKEEVKEVQIEAKEAIEKGISDLQKIYKDGSIKTFFTSFESLLKLESPKLFQSLTTIGTVTTPINPIAGIVTGLIGIIGGVASSYLTTKNEINKSEFSYLFRAKELKIID